ncbi:MAG: M12 family metallo-peptidase [Prevotellaceae bacterium]|jgi:hypothetical protein|nr:M12 family metallo-peptidase [Prevotellaceae bacterium]
MKKKIITCCLFLTVYTVFGQKNVIFSEIQKAKNHNVQFDTISIVTDKASLDKNIIRQFKNPNDVYFLNYIPIEMKEKTKAINIIIPLANKELALELVEVSENFYDYEVVTSDGKTYPANKNIKHYRGIVKDEDNSIVAITLYNDEIIGMIATKEGNFNIVKDINSMRHILFNDNNLIREHDFYCGTIDDNSISYSQDVLFQNHNFPNNTDLSTQSLIANRNVKIYLETEYDIYQNKGNKSAVEAFVTGLFNQVALLYQNEDILTTLSQIYIWTANDPYTATNTDDLLIQFQTNRTSFNGHLGQLLTFRDVGGGIAAAIGGLCNSSVANRLSVARIDNTFNTFPNYSWTVSVITHEFGHLLGSSHTHACVWNGNNTAIDGCAGGTEGNCSNPGYPSGEGTIMSYCHLSGRPGISFNLGFGTQPGNVIRNAVNNALCLIEILGSNSVYAGQSYTYTVPNLPAGTYVQWGATNNVSFSSGTTGQSATLKANNNSSTATIYAFLSGTMYKTLYKNISVAQGNFYVDYYGDYAVANFFSRYVQCFEWNISGFNTEIGTGDISCAGSGNSCSLTLTPLPGATSGYVAARAHYESGFIGDWYLIDIPIWRPVFDVANSTCGEESFSIGLVDGAYCGQGNLYYWTVDGHFYGVTYDPYVTIPWCLQGKHTISVTYEVSYCDAIHLNGSLTFNTGCYCSSSSAYSAAYPNPAGNELIIDREETNNAIQTQSTQINNETVKVLLYSHSTTKLAYSKDFQASAQQIKIDTSQLPDGIYYLNIISNNEKIKEQTIIVKH